MVVVNKSGGVTSFSEHFNSHHGNAPLKLSYDQFNFEFLLNNIWLWDVVTLSVSSFVFGEAKMTY